jgi:hypothetical protein
MENPPNNLPDADVADSLTAAQVLPFVRALADFPSQDAFDAANEAYARFIRAENSLESWKLSALCCQDLDLVTAYQEMVTTHLENDLRFPGEENGWTSVRAIAFRVEGLHHFAPLVQLPAATRRGLRIALENATEWVGDVHLSTLAMLLPDDTPEVLPDHLLAMVQFSTDGTDYGGDLPLIDIMGTESAIMVMMATLHISDIDRYPEPPFKEQEEMESTCYDVDIAALNCVIDMPATIGGIATAFSCDAAVFGLGEAVCLVPGREFTNGIVSRLNSEPAPKKPRIVLRCAPGQDKIMNLMQVRGYDIAAELYDGQKLLDAYDFGLTLAPAFILGYLLQLIDLTATDATVELSHDRGG